jgi:hypothetical protein
MQHKLISIALITTLLFMVLGNSIGCGTTPPTTQYTLTTTSTAGGNVTTPGEGTYTYNASQVVNLVATLDSGYRFVNWTATAGTFGNATAATTTYTMPSQNATVTAHFALGVLIANVPDANQPPTQTLPATVPTNFCAPMAVANIMEYWDDVANNASAQNVTAGLIPETVAEYLGWFMDTNNMGRSTRFNPGFPGTYNLDILPGIAEFARWDAANQFMVPPPLPPALPAGKLGYNWGVIATSDTNYTNTLAFYKNEIDNGRPLVVAFDYWNPVSKASYPDPETGETIDVFTWGDYVSSSGPPNPVEYWTYGDIGHAVTGVGYILNWDPDGSGGPLPSANWTIVHDNWNTTPENVAIPWENWMCLWQVIPGP